MLRRFAAYLDKIFDFRQRVERLRDRRRHPQIPTSATWLSVFGMFACRLRSCNALEQPLRRRGLWEKWVGRRKPSADTLGYSLSRFDVAGVRQFLRDLNRMAWRGKAIQGRPANRLRVVALDGHETFASAARCCHQCLIREETRDGQPIKIYYHRIVVAQWVGVTPPAILDIEPVLPGEGEVVAAKRMLPRLLAAYGRLIDVFTVDSLYLEGPFLQQVYDAGKHFVAVMKQESRDLYQDSEQLRQTFPPQVVQEGTRTLSLWDIPNLTTFPTFGHPVRVVCSFEQEKKKIIRGGHKESVVEDHQWRWVTDLPVDQVSATQIARFGHDRWDEENRGFNELDHLWGLDHCFVHDPVAILVILLTLAIAFLTTYLFYERNCQPAVRARITRETFSIDLREGFATDRGPSLWSASPDTS